MYIKIDLQLLLFDVPFIGDCVLFNDDLVLFVIISNSSRSELGDVRAPIGEGRALN